MTTPTYEQIARRVYADESCETELTGQEAKIVAAGWAGEYYCPALYRWVSSGRGHRAELMADARTLWDDLSLHVTDWPHAGQPWPSIAAVAALTHYLQTSSDIGD
ncbi:hypothetical protein [Nocardia terpenica]|uniref:Uncharacterized protein n=1 Tax=Nocardia terpenica TaxID=455432 RepID=A0A164HCN0_9NOCA|nr:hypothetical protein [Nocardia terpenica]KZM68398.1 hypothetical protein AWN90_10955 [Nocardia terpenica]NQE88681.1 hypothetical protein [Nocardia terpenica]